MTPDSFQTPARDCPRHSGQSSAASGMPPAMTAAHSATLCHRANRVGIHLYSQRCMAVKFDAAEVYAKAAVRRSNVRTFVGPRERRTTSVVPYGHGDCGRDSASCDKRPSGFAALVRAMGSWRTAAVALLSFSSGLPLGLVWYAIPDWMRSIGVDLRVVGLFTLAQAPWAFKVLWSPLMDRYVPPFWGRRRGWIAISQVALARARARAGRRRPSCPRRSGWSAQSRSPLPWRRRRRISPTTPIWSTC